MKVTVNTKREFGKRSPMIYGHFIEHFHRQIYDGIFDPGNALSDEHGLRTDVLEAMRKIRVPIMRWPGGCFVSSYHWKDAVGPKRTPLFDKAWRVEDPNSFGTDEFVNMCRKIGCEPYICTNAGTGTAEEMSDWVEYCNLESEGQYAKQRIANGCEKPHGVKYWSIGNENYGDWEIGAKDAAEWSRLVCEAAKMIKHVDPTTELSAAALTDLDWNIALLKSGGQFLDWISIHQYWDAIQATNDLATYEQCMAYTHNLSDSIDRVRGLLMAMGLDKTIKIAFDEWNLRGWYHPNVHSVRQGIDKADYLTQRDDNDINSQYTMADAVFTACFLNTLNRNCDIVGMANYAPTVNTRGLIYTHRDGIVLRGTYHVFDLYVNELGDTVMDSFTENQPEMTVTHKSGEAHAVTAIDMLATKFEGEKKYAVAVVNKHASESCRLQLALEHFQPSEYRISSVLATGTEAYNDVDREDIAIHRGDWTAWTDTVTVAPHSINIIQIR